MKIPATIPPWLAVALNLFIEFKTSAAFNKMIYNVLKKLIEEKMIKLM
jgi:hypothetical protein